MTREFYSGWFLDDTIGGCIKCRSGAPSNQCSNSGLDANNAVITVSNWLKIMHILGVTYLLWCVTKFAPTYLHDLSNIITTLTIDEEVGIREYRHHNHMTAN